MITIILSLLSALAQSPTNAAIESKKAALVSLRCDFVADNKNDLAHGDTNMTYRRSQLEAQLEAQKARRDSFANMADTELQEELRRVENREPKADSDLEQIEEDYETDLRQLIVDNAARKAAMIADLDQLIVSLQLQFQVFDNAIRDHRAVVERIEMLDRELETLGVHMQPVATETGWSRYVQATSRFPVTRCPAG